MASSILLPGEVMIDDSTPDAPPTPEGKSTGLRLGLRSTSFGKIQSAPPFPSELLVPRSDWQGWIQDAEESQTRISDICLAAGLPCKDQAQTNYCWINAPTHCVEILRVVQNETMVILSPASAGGPIKNFRNDGGWGEEGLKWIVEHGLCPASLWPANAIEKRYYTKTAIEAAKNYRVTEWMELVPRNLDQLISCLLRRIPVAVGYNWWGHEVTACDAVWLDGTVSIRIRNSWGMSWGSKGFGILSGSKMFPDDAVAPRLAVAS